MPLIVTSQQPEPPPPGPATPSECVDVTWHAPDGSELPMMARGPGVHVLAGGEGWGAAPRATTRRSLAVGGTMARWSHAAERLISLPLHLQAEDEAAMVTLRRRLARLMTQTTPPAGVPRPGTLRVTRADGTWREIDALYVDGLSWTDDTVAGPYIDRPVLQLVAPDPWWYGDATVALEFGPTQQRDYLDPYETVSASTRLGTVELDIAGDVPVSPVWTIAGPADSATVQYPDGPGWTFDTALTAGETVTIDVQQYTVTDATGANRIADLAWPTSTLFTLQPGPQELTLSLVGGVPDESEIRLEYRPRWETA